MLREALAIRQKSMAAGHWQVAEAESALGWCLSRMNRGQEARPLVAAALDTLNRQLGPSHRLARTARRRLAEMNRSGRIETRIKAQPLPAIFLLADCVSEPLRRHHARMRRSVLYNL